MGLSETEILTIEAEFLIESISDLLFLIAKEKGVSNALKWQLGELLSRYMSTYHSNKNTTLAMPLIRASKTIEKEIRDMTNRLYSQIIIEYADSSERNWDPWFVCTFQRRLVELIGDLTGDEDKLILDIRKRTKKGKIASKWFNSVLAFVEQQPEISSQDHAETISSKKYTSMNSWSGLARTEVSEQEFASFSEPILSKLPTRRKTMIDQVLMLLLILSSNS